MRHSHSLSHKKVSWLILIFSLIVVFAIRMIVINKYNYPPSSDLAGDLLVADSYFSNNPLHPEWKFVSPPLYYLLIVEPFTTFLPLFLGLKVYDILLPTIIGIPFFLLCKEISKNDIVASVVAPLFAFSEPYNEIIGWGGALNVAGIFFSLFAFYYLLKSVKNKKYKYIILASIFLSLVAGTHVLTTVFVALTIGGMLFLLLFIKEYIIFKTILKTAILALIFSIPYSYVYIYIMLHSTNLAEPTFFLNIISLMIVSIENYMRPIILFIPLAVFAFIYFFKYCNRNEDKAFIGGLLASTLFLIPLLNPAMADRTVYFLPIPFYLALGFCLADFLRGGLK